MRVEGHDAATAAGRHPPPRLIPSRRSVAPISEDRERPRNRFRGRFRFSVRKERFPTRTRCLRGADGFARVVSPARFRPHVSSHSISAASQRERTDIEVRARVAAVAEFRHEARKRCTAMLGAGDGGTRVGTRIAGRRRPAMRRIDRTVSSGAGSHPARCARHCRGACRSQDAMHRRDDIGSTGERRRKPQVAGSIPACRSFG